MDHPFTASAACASVVLQWHVLPPDRQPLFIDLHSLGQRPPPGLDAITKALFDRDAQTEADGGGPEGPEGPGRPPGPRRLSQVRVVSEGPIARALHPPPPHPQCAVRLTLERPTTVGGAPSQGCIRRGGTSGGGGQMRLDRRLEEVTEAVGGGCCRLQMPFRLALAVRHLDFGLFLAKLICNFLSSKKAGATAAGRPGPVLVCNPSPEF